MGEPTFPLYRRSANGLNWYRIDSPVDLVEVQHVGRRLLLHRMKAEAYPEKARIMELILMVEAHAHACPGAEVEAMIGRAEGMPG